MKFPILFLLAISSLQTSTAAVADNKQTVVHRDDANLRKKRALTNDSGVDVDSTGKEKRRQRKKIQRKRIRANRNRQDDIHHDTSKRLRRQNNNIQTYLVTTVDIVGILIEDSVCEIDSQCVEGLFCIDNRCSEKSSDGEMCSSNDDCQSNICVWGACTSGLVDANCISDRNCDAEAEPPLICISNKCSELLADEETCSSNDQCTSEACIKGACSSGLIDQNCSTDRNCDTEADPPLFCFQETCTDTKLSDGEICSKMDDCQSNICIWGTCTSGLVDANCISDRNCDAEAEPPLICISNKCSELLADEETCSSNDQCTSGECIMRACSSGLIDQNCSTDSDCDAEADPPLICTYNKCSEKLADEETCSSNNQCESGACIKGACSSGLIDQNCSADSDCNAEAGAPPLICIISKCSERIAGGEPCSSSKHCRAGLCLLGECAST